MFTPPLSGSPNSTPRAAASHSVPLLPFFGSPRKRSGSISARERPVSLSDKEQLLALFFKAIHSKNEINKIKGHLAYSLESPVYGYTNHLSLRFACTLDKYEQRVYRQFLLWQSSNSEEDYGSLKAHYEIAAKKIQKRFEITLLSLDREIRFEQNWLRSAVIEDIYMRFIEQFKETETARQKIEHLLFNEIDYTHFSFNDGSEKTKVGGNRSWQSYISSLLNQHFERKCKTKPEPKFKVTLLLCDANKSLNSMRALVRQIADGLEGIQRMNVESSTPRTNECDPSLISEYASSKPLELKDNYILNLPQDELEPLIIKASYYRRELINLENKISECLTHLHELPVSKTRENMSKILSYIQNYARAQLTYINTHLPFISLA